MKTFEIPVVWQEFGVLQIEANSIEEAIEEALFGDEPLPSGDYVGDSMQIDWSSLDLPIKEIDRLEKKFGS